MNGTTTNDPAMPWPDLAGITFSPRKGTALKKVTHTSGVWVCLDEVIRRADSVVTRLTFDL